MHSRYLPREAVQILISLFTTHPMGAVGGTLLLIGIVYGGLKWKFGRGGTDLFGAAVVLAVLAGFIGSCVWVLVRSPGYRVL